MAKVLGGFGNADTNLDRAIKDFTEALRLRPERSETYILRASSYKAKGQHDRSIADLDEAIRLDPNFADGYKLRGDVYQYGKREYDRAIADYSEAIRLRRDDPDTLASRAEAYFRLNQYDRAASDYSEVVRLKPDDPAAHAAQADANREAEQARRLAAKADARRFEDERRTAEAEAKRSADKIVHPPKPQLATRRTSRRVALVIGNSAYSNAPRLNNPATDTQAVAKSLRRLGFADVIEHHDLGAEDMRKTLKTFGDKAAQADWAVVYFAGHGIQVNQTPYLVPTDAKLLRASHADDEAVSLSYVLSKVEDAKQLRLVILDACRENPFLSRMEIAGGTRSLGRGLARIEPQRGVLVAYAARDGQVAQDGETKHSPFTAALLEHLEEPGLEMGLLFRKVRDDVLKRTGGAQEPYTYGSLPSEGLYFKAAVQ